MPHRLHGLLHHLVLLRGLLQDAAFLHARECAGDDKEAGEQDPGREGGEDVVRARDVVEREEHGHVVGLLGVCGREPGVVLEGFGRDCLW